MSALERTIFQKLPCLIEFVTVLCLRLKSTKRYAQIVTKPFVNMTTADMFISSISLLLQFKNEIRIEFGANKIIFYN